MKCLLVFDNLNDIIYTKYNEKFSKHVWALARLQGLVSEGNDEELRDTDLILQLFSPLVTSQRVMINHFSNAYASVKCYDGLSIIFDEVMLQYMGYVFACIGYTQAYWLKRQLSVFIASVKRICGPDVSILKTSEKRGKLVGALITSWSRLVRNEQSILVEAIEQLRLNSQVASSCLKTLTEAAEKTKFNSQVHALVLVNHRFVSLYSTRSTPELLSSDMLFLSLIGEVVELGVFEKDCKSTFEIEDDDSDSEDENESNDNFYTPNDSKVASDSFSMKSCVPASNEGCDFSFNTICLLGKQRPNAIHVLHVARNIPIFIVYETGNEVLNSSILETIQAVYSLQNLQIRGTTDRQVIHSAVDSVESTIKKMADAFKKKASPSLSKIYGNDVKKIIKKWEPIRKKYQDYLKSHNVELLQTIDSTIENLMSLLRNTYSTCMMDEAHASVNHDVILPILYSIRKALQDFTEMFQVKVHRNFSLASKSTLSINKYLEEFPGLVHFLYIDRVTHRFVAPSLDFNSPETTNLTKKKIWSMFEFARTHLQEGHLYLIWKDTVFNYSYFLWFEDKSGTPLKPKTSPITVIKSLPTPGVLTGDFYHQLIKKCFPTQPSQRIRCYELFAIHLGLVTSSSVLEQARRLTATIWEVTGVSTNSSHL